MDSNYISGGERNTDFFVNTNRLDISYCKNLNSLANDIDTIVVADLSDLHTGGQEDPYKPVLEWAVNNDKNVFCMAPIELSYYKNIYDLATCRGLSIKSTADYARDLMTSEPDNLEFDIDSPVIGIFGTSFNQGKTATALMLGHNLHSEGYSVEHIGFNSALALLNNAVHVSQDLRYGVTPGINGASKYFEMAAAMAFCSRPQILIASSMGFITPPSLYQINAKVLNEFPAEYSIPSIAFLLAIKPDAAILVVNSTDAEQYISRSIAVIENMSNARVIALVLSDKVVHDSFFQYNQMAGRNLSDEEIVETSNRFHAFTGLPVYCSLKDDSFSSLSQHVVDSFEAA